MINDCYYLIKLKLENENSLKIFNLHTIIARSNLC